MSTDYSGYNDSADLPRTIRARVRLPDTFEHVAAGACKPGHVLKRNSDDKVLVNSSSGVRPELLVAIEDVLQSKTIDDAYASGDVVTCIRPIPGDQVLLRVAASATALVVNDGVTVHTDGTVKKRTVTADTFTVGSPDTFAQEQYLVARVDKAVDNSAGTGEAFVLVTIL